MSAASIRALEKHNPLARREQEIALDARRPAVRRLGAEGDALHFPSRNPASVLPQEFLEFGQFLHTTIFVAGFRQVISLIHYLASLVSLTESTLAHHLLLMG